MAAPWRGRFGARFAGQASAFVVALPEPGAARPQHRAVPAAVRHGELDDAEIEKLLPLWEHAYRMATRPGHMHCLGPGEFLEGRAAREATLMWAGIPQEFVDKWDTLGLAFLRE